MLHTATSTCDVSALLNPRFDIYYFQLENLGGGEDSCAEAFACSQISLVKLPSGDPGSQNTTMPGLFARLHLQLCIL